MILNRKCPKCNNGKLLKRYNKSTQKYFWGCSNYPACNYTKNKIRLFNYVNTIAIIISLLIGIGTIYYYLKLKTDDSLIIETEVYTSLENYAPLKDVGFREYFVKITNAKFDSVPNKIKLTLSSNKEEKVIIENIQLVVDSTTKYIKYNFPNQFSGMDFSTEASGPFKFKGRLNGHDTIMNFYNSRTNDTILFYDKYAALDQFVFYLWSEPGYQYSVKTKIRARSVKRKKTILQESENLKIKYPKFINWKEVYDHYNDTIFIKCNSIIVLHDFIRFHYLELTAKKIIALMQIDNNVNKYNSEKIYSCAKFVNSLISEKPREQLNIELFFFRDTTEINPNFKEQYISFGQTSMLLMDDKKDYDYIDFLDESPFIDTTDLPNRVEYITDKKIISEHLKDFGNVLELDIKGGASIEIKPYWIGSLNDKKLNYPRLTEKDFSNIRKTKPSR